MWKPPHDQILVTKPFVTFHEIWYRNSVEKVVEQAWISCISEQWKAHTFNLEYKWNISCIFCVFCLIWMKSWTGVHRTFWMTMSFMILTQWNSPLENKLSYISTLHIYCLIFGEIQCKGSQHHAVELLWVSLQWTDRRPYFSYYLN